MAAQDLFDFETVIPTAVKLALVDPAVGLNAFIISDPPAFQKIRPRAEITYQNIGETKPRRMVFLSDGTRRGSAFNGILKIYAITDADVPGKAVHADYRTKVRNVLAGLQDLVNGNTLLYHKIQWLEPGNEATGIRTQDGFQQTTFPFQVMLSIQRNAWDTILTQQPISGA